MALKAVGVSAVILLLFALGGAAFLDLMGISLEAFRIFGGLLLFLLALEMVFARESGTRTSSGEAAESRAARISRFFRWRFRSSQVPGRSPPFCCGSALCTLPARRCSLARCWPRRHWCSPSHWR